MVLKVQAPMVLQALNDGASAFGTNDGAASKGTNNAGGTCTK